MSEQRRKQPSTKDTQADAPNPRTQDGVVVPNEPPRGEKRRRVRMEDCIKVGEGMIVTGDNVVIQPGSLAALISEMEHALPECADFMARAKTADERVEAYKGLNRWVKAIKARWERLKHELVRHDCFTHGDLYNFEKRLNDFVTAGVSVAQKSVGDDRNVWQNCSALTPGEIWEAVASGDRRWSALRATAFALIREAVALEDRLEDVIESRSTADHDAPARTSPPLTERQRQVLEIIQAHPRAIMGQQIADRCDIGLSTITRHIIPVLKKYHSVKNRRGAGYYVEST